METIKTAEDFITGESNGYDNEQRIFYYTESKVRELLILYAKYHVDLALKESSEKADMIGYNKEYAHWIDRESILNAYPLSNIK